MGNLQKQEKMMKTAEAVFVLHGDVNRKTNLLDLLKKMIQ